MKIRHLLPAALAAATLALPHRAAAAAFGESERQAFAAAMADVSASLRASAIPDAAGVSVLAVRGDRDDTVAGFLKIAVTDAGKTYVEGKDDPMWEAVVKELAWDERKGEAGFLAPKTIDAIGSLKASNVLLYGVVRECSQSENRVFVELELHATDVKTKQHVWGGLFAKRWYVPGADVPKGISDLPHAVRARLREGATARLVESFRAQPRLAGVRSVALVPLAGDEDRYCTYIVRDALVKTDATPKELDLGTLQGARATFRDLPAESGDAVIYGAVRRLDYRVKKGPLGLFARYKVDLDFQGAIERNDTHDVLWSDTVQTFEEWTEWDWVRVGLYGAAVLVALALLRSFLRAATRVR